MSGQPDTVSKASLLFVKTSNPAFGQLAVLVAHRLASLDVILQWMKHTIAIHLVFG